MPKNITLSELTSGIRDSINIAFPEKYYLTAEISEINESRGHAYIELIEKSEDDHVLAKIRATIWSKTYRLIKPYFETSTGRQLESGLKVLVVVNVEFHEVYGISLNILDIDPNYTLGEIEQKRLAIIRRLDEEGVTDMNKELEIPLVPQRIAIISSETAAGYEDFVNQLINNEFGYKFYTKLFQAAMQGEDTEGSIINALDKIFEKEDMFDLVVIIRGGGSKSDLSWFDSYDLALNISQFPLPVLTGIGHEKDSTITDMVACVSLKTPTAVAEFLIGKVSDFDSYLEQLKSEFIYSVSDIINSEKQKLNNIAVNFKPVFIQNIAKNKTVIDIFKTKTENAMRNLIFLHKTKIADFSNSMINVSKKLTRNQYSEIEKLELNFQNKISNFLKNNFNKLEVYKQKNNFLDPASVFERGYSLTTLNGKIVKSVEDIMNDDVITTKLIDGSFKSKVEN